MLCAGMTAVPKCSDLTARICQSVGIALKNVLRPQLPHIGHTVSPPQGLELELHSGQSQFSVHEH